MKRSLIFSGKYITLAAFLVLVLSMLLGCSGSTGPAGPAGAAGTSAAASTGTISGKVETSTGTALSGITVSAYVYNSSSATGYKQSTDANQNYQNAKALLASSSTPVATTTTAADGSYSLSVAQGVYTVVFSDPNGNYTLGSQIGLSVTAGATQTVNAGMGSSITVGSTTKGAPTVTVAPSQTNEVGFGNTVALTATATSPISGATLSYKWAATYSVNPGGSATVTPGTPASTATVTMPTIAQAQAGIPDATAGMPVYAANNALYDVPPYTQPSTIGVMPILADTRGTVSTTVTVSDGQGGTASASVSSNAAGTQTGLNNVPVGEPVYLNSGYGTVGAANVASWSLTTVPAGSKAALSNPTTRNASFTPDLAGTYVVKDSGASASSSNNTLTIYAGTWQGIIKGGGETTATVPATGFTAFTTPAGGTSQLAVGIWATSAGTYTDFPYVTVDTSCTACHANSVVVNGLTAPNKFTPWTGTAHATFFARGLNNITANSGSCLTCHTVGYDQAPNAGNNGFDDVAALDGWAYPTKQAGQWKTLVTTPATANLAQLGNIQCENCHGPQQSGGHISGMIGSSTGTPGGTRVSYSAEDCAICHADGTGHHIYSEWAASPNPGTPGDTIQILATPTTPSFSYQIVAGSKGAGHGAVANHTTITSCSRCHTSEGFKAYVDQLKQYTNNQQYPSVAGVLESQYVPLFITGGSATVAGTATINTTTNPLHALQTCTACHDPHDDSNPYQLRMYNSVPSTMAGTGVSGLGAGAVCTICHSDESGGAECDAAHQPNALGTCLSGSVQSGPTFLHEDTDPTNVNPPAGFPTYPAGLYFDTPGMVTQTEVLLGRDAFFMGGSLPMVSPHANVQDSCVGCHMTLNPSTHSSHGTPAANTHVWYITDAERPALCANCHGSTGDVSGLGLVTNTLNSRTQLVSAIGTGMKAALAKLYPNGGTIYVGGTASSNAINVSQITAVSMVNIYSGATALSSPPSGSTFYFYTSAVTNGVAAANYVASGKLSTIYTSSAGTTPVFSPNGIFRKAIWNLGLIVDDYSNGIHNPAFVTAVLSNSIAAVTNLNYIDPRTGTPLPY